MIGTALLAIVLTSTLAITALPESICRVIPGDEPWPADHVWSSFNASIGGTLVRTVPLAAVCHGSSYDREKCDALRDNWFFPATHLLSASSPMSYQASNDSCNPFLGPETPCTVGAHAPFTVNATSVDHLKAALEFVKTHNIRLVIRNSGHDYLGKSTGAHALALWTRHLKSIELLKDFESEHYSGNALKVGAGVDGGEAQDFAHAHGLLVVTGNCPTVGIAGGYIQGGGHSPLSSFIGLGADQVLEYEVLTSNGELLTATPSKNEDLFWALSGGGGGTYGIVVSMILKLHPEVQTSTAVLAVPRPDNSSEAIQDFLSTFLQNLLSIVDAGVFVVWVLLPTAFMIMPAFAPNLTQPDLDTLFHPILSKLTTLDLPHQYTSTPYPDFHTAFASTPQLWNVSDSHPAGRLIPRSLITSNLPALVDNIVHIATQTMAVGVSYNLAPHTPAHGRVSANPRLRTSLFNLVTGLPLDYTDSAGWPAADAMLQDEIMGPIRELVPEGGAYLSETSLNEPDWQAQFYGGHYDELLKVKDKYDPEEVFYVPTGVGSHRWVVGTEGRLCRVQGEDWSHREL